MRRTIVKNWRTFTRSSVMLGMVAALNAGCSGSFKIDNDRLEASGYKGGSGTLNVSWAANPEPGVNANGGGCKVYYSQVDHIGTYTPYVIVSNTSGSTPSATSITGLVKGTYYVRVIAFSSVNATGSAVSTPASVVIK